MSKSKLDRRFNKRGRLQPTETKIDESEQKKLTQAFLESEGGKDVDYSVGYDAANALILPAKKRKVKHKYDVQTNNNKLSKKEKKRLEKIVEIKDKKLNRQKIFESLALHRASEKAEAQFVSIANPDGVKGGSGAGEEGPSVVQTHVKINSIAGSNKKNRQETTTASSSEDEDDDDEDDGDDEDDEIEMQVGEEEKVDDSGLGDQTAIAETEDHDREEPASSTSDSLPLVTGNASPTDAVDPASTTSTAVTAVARQPAKFVMVERDEAIAAARLKLPILEEEQRIVETINENDVTIGEETVFIIGMFSSVCNQKKILRILLSFSSPLLASLSLLLSFPFPLPLTNSVFLPSVLPDFLPSVFFISCHLSFFLFPFLLLNPAPLFLFATSQLAARPEVVKPPKCLNFSTKPDIVRRG